jgi:hypothetical protein
MCHVYSARTISFPENIISLPGMVLNHLPIKEHDIEIIFLYAQVHVFLAVVKGLLSVMIFQYIVHIILLMLTAIYLL